MLAAAGVRIKLVIEMSENLMSLADSCSCCKHGVFWGNACWLYTAGKLSLFVSLFKPFRFLELKTLW